MSNMNPSTRSSKVCTMSEASRMFKRAVDYKEPEGLIQPAVVDAEAQQQPAQHEDEVDMVQEAEDQVDDLQEYDPTAMTE